MSDHSLKRVLNASLALAVRRGQWTLQAALVELYFLHNVCWKRLEEIFQLVFDWPSVLRIQREIVQSDGTDDTEVPERVPGVSCELLKD